MGIFECAFHHWKPGIGDPHLMGWATVAVYALSAALALAVARRAHFPAATLGRERLFWLFAGLLLVFLAVNKQLDLQSLLTAIGRCISQIQGWYEVRRAVQAGFVTGLIVLTGVVGGLVFWTLRMTLRRTGIPLLGLILVSCFVLVRAVSFHHMDNLIGSWCGVVRVNWALEIPGPILVAASALWLLRQR
jgi:hypothetical protein